jgi:signal transduction histidine kinase
MPPAREVRRVPGAERPRADSTPTHDAPTRDASGARTPLDDALALGRALLGVPILRLAWLPGAGPTAASGDPPAGGSERHDASAHFSPGDPVGRALATEVQQLDGPLVVEDTRSAAPLHGIPVVDGLRIMACLAVPMAGAPGTPDGALCALDSVPRWWSDRDSLLLTSLARVVAALLAPRAAGDEAPPPIARGDTPLLESIERLAGGVAHDFNNLLTVIAANAELLRHHPLDAPSPAVELEAIERAARQATELTWQLLAFSRQLPASPEPLPVHTWLAELEAPIRACLPAGVRLEFAWRADSPQVRADPALLRHAVLALVENASEALGGVGVVRIETARLTLDAPYAAHPEPVPAGAWIRLSVVDSGPGLAPSVVRQLFEPFFTTRDVRRGRGLGLSAVHGIVAQVGGCCTVESAVGEGTRVHLWVPPLPLA